MEEINEIMEGTKERVATLDGITQPGKRLVQSIDFQIRMEYTNGIHLALACLAEVESIVQREPSRVLV